ncbi:MAG: hypothetical protein ABIT01_10105 [Thermoanaerobaculia bacterium]
MRNATLAATLAAATFITGCASGGARIPDSDVAQSELAIRAAENATATQHARELLDRARTALSAAQNERAKGANDDARAHLGESLAAAAAAESQARAMQIEEQTAAARKRNDDLEKRIRELNDQGRAQ